MTKRVLICPAFPGSKGYKNKSSDFFELVCFWAQIGHLTAALTKAEAALERVENEKQQHLAAAKTAEEAVQKLQEQLSKHQSEDRDSLLILRQEVGIWSPEYLNPRILYAAND